MHEVYAYGVIAASELIELGDEFPAEAGYAEITAVHASIGGEAASSAYVLARLGVATKLSGSRLGSDAASRRTMEFLTGSGVDCSAVERRPGAPAFERVLSSSGERTVLGAYGRMLAERAWSAPSHQDVRSASIVCLDPFLSPDSDRVASWCREAGIPYVTVDVPPDSEIARHAAASVISGEFADRTFETGDPHEVLTAYTGTCHGLVIVTQGPRSLFYGRPGGPHEEAIPFRVDAADTAGAGDAFRAGIVYGMVRGFSDERLVSTASAIAAMVCQRPPGVLHSPTEQELEEFLSA
jgi:sugar/nucleoside kinase (ribokinase family)